FGWNEVKLPLGSLTARNVPKSGNPLLVVCEGVAPDARAELVEGLNVRLLALSVRLALHLRVGVRGIPSWNDMAIACRRSRHNRGAEQGQDESDAGKQGYLLWFDAVLNFDRTVRSALKIIRPTTMSMTEPFGHKLVMHRKRAVRAQPRMQGERRKCLIFSLSAAPMGTGRTVRSVGKSWMARGRSS